jgi:hypothetical protein
MINCKELRVGNLIHGALVGERIEVEVDSITGDGINIVWGHELTDEDWRLDQLWGIPLTEEWLLKMGFESIASNVPNLCEQPSFDGQRQFRWDSIDGLAIQTVGSGWMWRIQYIEYVHQLQNLYFSLTGSELTIKEDI